MAIPDGVHKAEDGIEVPGQLYVVMAATTENKSIPGLACAVCVRGCFATLEEAQKHAKRIQEKKSAFNVYISWANAWVQLPPDESGVKAVYDDPRLDQLMHQEEEARKRGAESFKKRLNKAQQQGESLTPGEWATEQIPSSECDL